MLVPLTIYVTIPAGDVFVSSVDGRAFTFTVPEQITQMVDQQTGIASFNKTIIYQGNLLSYEYDVDVKKGKYEIP